jgi:hypothetical protein
VSAAEPLRTLEAWPYQQHSCQHKQKWVRELCCPSYAGFTPWGFDSLENAGSTATAKRWHRPTLTLYVLLHRISYFTALGRQLAPTSTAETVLLVKVRGLPAAAV